MASNQASATIGNFPMQQWEKVLQLFPKSTCKKHIMNAYEIKTGMNRVKISQLMDAESWFNARKAVELGFADEILEDQHGVKVENREKMPEGMMLSRATVTNSLMEKLIPKITEKKGTPVEQLEKRLDLLAH